MQGYLTIACGQQKYVDMAVNLARSIKYFDPSRPVCLVHDGQVNLSSAVRGAFDDVVLLVPDALYVGCMNKIRIYDVSPYEQTMYIDSDSLMVKNDIDKYWRHLQSWYFGMTGEKCVSGQWNSLNIEAACNALSLPYIVRMNSGVFYFRKCQDTQAFFQKVDALFQQHRTMLSNIHQNRPGQFADEPFFGATMGAFRIEPIDGEPSDDSLMVTTWRARRCHLDLRTGACSLEKPSRHLQILGRTIMSYGWVRHSPTILHFIGLKPRAVYDRAASFLEKAAA